MPISVFSKNLRRLRRFRGLTQAALAFTLGHANNSQVAKWETGRSVPRANTIERLAEALGVAQAELVHPNPDEQDGIDGLDLPAATIARIGSIVRSVLQEQRLNDGLQTPTVPGGHPSAVQAKLQRIVYLIRGLNTLESLGIIEHVVVTRLAEETHLLKALPHTSDGESGDTRPAHRTRLKRRASRG